MFIRLKNKLAFILANARYRALPQSIMSSVVIICTALNSKTFAPLNALLALTGVICVHLSANLFDDFFDYVQGKVQTRNKIKTGRALKCENIINGKAAPKDFFIWACWLGFSAAIIGLYFIIKTGFPVLYFIAAGAFFSICYSAPPFKLSYRGLGELTIGLMFGPLLGCGVYYVTTGTLDAAPVIVSIITGLLSANIVYVHSVVDMNADIACSKTTLAVLLQNDFLRFFALFLFTTIPYGLAFTISIQLGLILLITLPAAVYLLYVMRDTKRHKVLFKLIPRKIWKPAIKTGNEYFYSRWLLARDYMTLFVSIISLYYILKAVL